jgi:hypothetical protein
MISTNDATVTLFRRQTLEAKNVRTLLRFTVTGIVIGLLIGWLLSLVSGNIFVVLLVGSVGTLVGLILGFIHRNDP